MIMSVFILTGAFLVIFGSAYWLAGRLDRALSGGQFYQQWDAKEEHSSACTPAADKKAS